MATKTSTTRHVFRQRSPLALAVVSAVTCVLLLASLVRHWADNPQPLFLAWVLFVLALVWSAFVRPAVLLGGEGVTIRNVVRDVYIPWSQVSDVEFRWNLKVFVGDRGYSAWAISSQVERPRSATGGMFGFGFGLGRLDKYARPSSKLSPPAPKVTASMVARSIDAAKEAYDEAVARGALPAAPDDRVRITWVPLAVAILVLPVIAVVALSLT